ncbi:MAG TPA: 3'-5' exonuclease [Candidatus Baltobacteraceae bacterium]|nr:3'-5' exonuclease [Candidatus Baltobacteraceae bacterium]
MSAQPIREGRFAFVDVETTGIDAATCAVVEVACQIVERGQVVATFESLVDPGCAIPPFVTAIHGIDDSMVVGKPQLRDLVPTLLDHCQGAVVVAHNAAFDRRFLPFLAAHPSACSWKLAARVVPEAPNHKNQTLRKFFGVRDPKLRGRRSHRALADVIVTRHVFFHCVDRYVAAGYDDHLEALFDFLQPKYQRAKSA